MVKHVIGDVNEFPNRKGVKKDVNGIEVAVFRDDDEFFAIQNRCPHKNLPLHLVGHERKSSKELMADRMGELDEVEEMRGRFNLDCGSSDLDCGSSINCPWHYLEWDLETGENEIKDMHIATYDIETTDDDEVIIEI